MRGFDIKISEGEKQLVDISFDFEESIAIVGESGSGKSLTLKAILGLLPSNLRGTVTSHTNERYERGSSLAFVPQNPFTALSPMSKIKKQFWGVDRARAMELLISTGLDESVLKRYPSELSGGQLQRVIIALSLAQNPKLLLMDEPTTALDNDTKAEIVSLIKTLKKRLGFDMIFVTHELELARELCADTLVISKGRVVEFGKSETVLKNPKSEYTKRLIESDFKNREFRK